MSSATTTAIKTQLLIGGVWRDASGGESYENRNPATGALLADVADATAADVDAAVAAARQAFDTGKWASMAASRRAKIIYKMAQLLGEHSKELMLLEVRDNGKAVSTAKGELGAIVDTFEFYAGAATKNYGETMPPPLPTYLASTVREPVGVVGAIVPWNFPLLLAAWKVAPALAAGCTIVLKPSSSTPLTALELGKIALEAGVPEGVLNVVTGSPASSARRSWSIRASTRSRSPVRRRPARWSRQARRGRSSGSRSNSAANRRR